MNEKKLKKNRKYLLALDIALNTFGFERLKKIEKSGLNFEEVWEMPAGQLKQKLGKYNFVEKLASERGKIYPDTEIEKLEKQKIGFITIYDEEYPKNLKEIFSPPVILYYKGDLNVLNEVCLAVVGSRKYTTYGKNAAEKLVYGLSESGFTIVSGMALGIDTFAHTSALNAEGKTVAVLGCGLNQPYPSSNTNLFRQIINSDGLALSEYMPGKPPLPQHFPARNRIISGLSKGILIIEAGIRSGALITARDGLEQNKDIFTVPGPIFGESSSGTNQLLKMGANPVTQAEDIIEYYGYKTKPKIILKPSNNTEKAIFEALNKEKMHVDDIIKHAKLESQLIISTLTLMEIKGKVKNLGGMVYCLN